MSKTTPVFLKDVWQPCVDTWFNFFKDKFGEPPSFIGAATSSLQHILKEIRTRAINKGREWNRAIAVECLQAFLNRAWNHADNKFQRYMRDNFSLPQLLYNFDKIILMNGKPTTSFQQFAETIRELAG